MSTNETHGNESIEPRTERALTECMSVLPDGDGADVYTVVGENGGTYRVDGREERCTCPDHQHRNVRCKHIRRVAVATGAEPIPASVDGIDDQLGEHTDAAPQVVATDGGAEIVEGGDGAEILDDDGPEWVGPFTEFDRYGEPTGARFVRCPECGVEVLDDHRATASHRPACRFE